MSKKLTFTVTIEFADKITHPNHIEEVANNVVNAITSQADTAGIAPDEVTHTKSVEVKHDSGIKQKSTYNLNHGWINV